MTSYAAQFLDIGQMLLLHASGFRERLARVRAELAFADQLCSAHPDHATVWQPLIIEAGHIVDSGLRADQTDIAALTSQAEQVLAPIGDVAKRYALLCVGHAHIDMNWQWSWPETVALTHDTFQTMLALMDEFPAFIFSQSQASVYAAMEKYNPVMFEEIRRRVQDGRWEVTASQWVEGDKNLSSGESISRHLLLTRAYFQDKFGLAPEDVPIDFEPDTFGHPATLPTILAQGGVRYYYHCRGSRGPHLYWWVGPDGSKLLTLNDIQWYMHFNADRSRVAVAPNMADPLMDWEQATGLRQMPVLYGVGDHGGGPTRKDLRQIIEMDSWPIYPRLEFSTLRRFFELAEAEAQDLPEITGERNVIFAGCYTSQARQKEANRHGENLLYTAEAAAAMGAHLAGIPYPQENLEEGWQHHLFDQFHDILPGSGVRETRHFTLGHAQDTQAAAGMARTNALRGLAQRVTTEVLREGFTLGSPLRDYKDAAESGIAMGAGVGNATATGGESAFSVTRTSDRVYVVFNPLAHPRTEIVRAKLWDTQLDPAHLVLSSPGIAPHPVQVLEEGVYAGHRFLDVAFPVDVPALGYRAVCVSDRRVELGLPAPTAPGLWDGVGGALRTRELLDPTLENEMLSIRLDPGSGSLISLVDKRTGRDWVTPGDHIGVLQMCLEVNAGMTSWVIGQFKSREDLLQGGRLTKLHGGPHIQTMRWTRSLGREGDVGATTLVLDISVAAGVPRVDFDLRVDWREMGSRDIGIPHLKVRFPIDITGPVARYEIPFGSIRRDLFNGEEVPGQRWVDLSSPAGQGVTLVNRSKYGFNVEGNSLNMTLLRASIDPDPLPDLGQHVIAYALLPHDSSWAEGDMMRAGEDFNVPLVVMSSDFHVGDMPPVQSLISVVPKNVRLTALKDTEDGQGLVLRLIEVEGTPTEAVVTLSPTLASEAKGAVVQDTLERVTTEGSLPLRDNTFSVSLPAYGIRTVRIDL